MLLFFAENVSSSKKHRMREIVFLACIFTVKTVADHFFHEKCSNENFSFGKSIYSPCRKNAVKHENCPSDIFLFSSIYVNLK